MDEQKNLIKVVAGCKKGDKDSFDVLVDMYSSRLYGYLYRLTGNKSDSDDLLGELFLKIIEKIATCRAESFNAWVFRIAHNLFVDFIRNKKRQEKAIEKISEQVCSTTLPTEKTLQDSDELTMQLAKLDSATAEAIVLRYYSQLSFAQIAKIRNEPVGTTLSRVHRGIKKLRELMENKNEKF